MNESEKENSRIPRLIACPKTHDKVVEILSRFPDRGYVLDLAAGEGALSLRLMKIGFKVRANDLFPEKFIVPGIVCDGVDLNGPLPYEDESFDLLCCVEALEHLENQFGFIRECYRILRPGGKLIFTMPNILSLASRMKYLLAGFYPLTTKPINEFVRSPVRDHINPITWYQLRYMLHTNGFRIGQVETDRFRKSALVWFWMYPFLYLFTWATMRKESDPRQTLVNVEIRRILLSPKLLLGRTVITVATK